MAIPSLVIQHENRRSNNESKRSHEVNQEPPRLKRRENLETSKELGKDQPEASTRSKGVRDITKQKVRVLGLSPGVVGSSLEGARHSSTIRTSVRRTLVWELIQWRVHSCHQRGYRRLNAHLLVSVTVALITALTGCLASVTTEMSVAQEGVTVRQETPQGPTNEAWTLYQPSLIGFRSESSQDLTPDGVSVIEANSAVTLTLFGESFTTNTIVAFTTEDGIESDYDVPPMALPITTTTPASASRERQMNLTQELDQVITTSQRDSAAILTTRLQGRKSMNQARTRGASDCTDYNRVVSYKLNEENILSPQVAMLVVTLPELVSTSGRYYYFCLKQPRRLSGSSDGPARPMDYLETASNDSSSYVWVHQGSDWWVTLKVEPPILSMTNDCLLIMFLLFLSAVTSGLNLGLMSLDMNELAVISSCGDQRERSYARTIVPLRRRGNYLLCSLLLGNVMVNSTLTVILEEMTSGLVAIIGSTLAIVILGEIVPQAFCARQGLAIGAKTIYLTYAFMVITFPLSYPISCLLDYVLGEEKGNVYDRERLMEFIKITGHHTQLEADEVAIISGALKLKKIKVDQIMTRIEDVFMLPIDCKLDRETIKRIIEKGYSRIPVYEFGDRKQIVALILAKDLALLDPDDHTPIANMLLYCKHPLIFIEDDATLDVALNEFKTGKSHMAVVRQIYDDGEIDKYYEAIGVVTLEDVIEEVLQVEINDETDTLSDNRRKRRRTDAQLAHLIDEFTGASSDSSLQVASAASLALELGANGAAGAAGNRHSTPHVPTIAVSKQVQTSLSSHLTSVSVQSVAQSVGQSTQISGSQQQQQSQQTSQESQEQVGEAGMLSRAAQFLSNIMS